MVSILLCVTISFFIVVSCYLFNMVSFNDKLSCPRATFNRKNDLQFIKGIDKYFFLEKINQLAIQVSKNSL